LSIWGRYSSLEEKEIGMEVIVAKVEELKMATLDIEPRRE
jgi:hypothetical protein